MKDSIPLIGFVAYSGTGKTTLLSQLIPLLKQKGLRIGVIKHAHHYFDIDYSKKDSYILRKAGADTILIASHKRTAIIIEHPKIKKEPSLKEVLSKIPKEGLDLLLIEGFKHENYPKIELHRKILNKPYIYPNDENIIAIATDHTLDSAEKRNKPRWQFDLNQPEQLVEFILTQIMV